jgi:hypothetical protein
MKLNSIMSDFYAKSIQMHVDCCDIFVRLIFVIILGQLAHTGHGVVERVVWHYASCSHAEEKRRICLMVIDAYHNKKEEEEVV